MKRTKLILETDTLAVHYNFLKIKSFQGCNSIDLFLSLSLIYSSIGNIGAGWIHWVNLKNSSTENVFKKRKEKKKKHTRKNWIIIKYIFLTSNCKIFLRKIDFVCRTHAETNLLVKLLISTQGGIRRRVRKLKLYKLKINQMTKAVST